MKWFLHARETCICYACFSASSEYVSAMGEYFVMRVCRKPSSHRKGCIPHFAPHFENGFRCYTTCTHLCKWSLKSDACSTNTQAKACPILPENKNTYEKLYELSPYGFVHAEKCTRIGKPLLGYLQAPGDQFKFSFKVSG